MPYEVVRLETVYDGWCNLLMATIRTPEGHELRREIEEHGEAVVVLPFDPERRVATLVSQFRAPVFHLTGETNPLEAPAGILDMDDPEAEARREAMEEVGIGLSGLDRVATVWSCPGVSTERLHLFLGAYSEGDRTGPGGGLAEEHENITVLELPLADLAAMADEGRLVDMKTLCLVQSLRLRRPDLFTA